MLKTLLCCKKQVYLTKKSSQKTRQIPEAESCKITNSLRNNRARKSIVLIIAQKYMLFHIIVMKNIVLSLKGFKVQLFVTD